MKQCIMFGVMLLMVALPSWGQKPFPTPPLDLSSQELQKLIAPPFKINSASKSSPLDPVLAIGERNLLWLEKINSQREPNDRIKLSDPNSLKGVPIEDPVIYSETIILAEYNKLLAQLDVATKKILLGEEALTEQPTLPDAEFQKQARRIEILYSRSLRWIMLLDYRPWLIANEAHDVRGFYFLSRHPQREEYLKNYLQQAQEDQQKIAAWLIQMCRNSLIPNKKECTDEFTQNVSQKNDLNKMYDKYLQTAKENWDFFFSLIAPRTDVEYTKNSAKEFFTVPFLDPITAAVKSFIKDHVEDEWKGSQWNLRVDYRAQADARVEFQKGVTPHVRAWQVIVLDEQTDFQDFGNQWMIRHEFGHILGFLDCYLEFYDVKLEAIVSYQLDTSNLMCSRGGKLQPIHFEKLRREYSPAP